MTTGKLRRAWSLAAALMSVNAGCGGYRPVPDFDPGELREPTAVENTPLTMLWRSKPDRGPSQPLAVDDSNAYLGGSDRRLVAVDLASGRTRWAVRFGGPLVGGTLVDGPLVYAASDKPEGEIRALRTESGSRVWRVNVGYVEAPLARIGHRIIATTRSNRVYAIDKTSGEVLWRRPLPSSRVPPLPLDGDRVLLTSYDSLYLVQAASGAVTVRRPTPGPVTAPWVRLGRRLIGVTGDSTIVEVDPDSLLVRASTRLDAPLLNRPAISGDTLYAVTQTGSVWLVDATAGLAARRLSQLDAATVGAPQVVGEWLLVGSADGNLHGLLRETGEEGWHLRLGRPAEIPPLLLPGGDFLALGGRGDLQRLKL